MYLVGLSLSLIKVYYDFQDVTGYEKKLIISFVADALLVIAIGFSCFRKLRTASVAAGVMSLIYFYVVLGFGSRGSAHLSCEMYGYCQNSVDYDCTNINSKGFSGTLHLFGTGLKIIAVTLILRDIWSKYKGSAVSAVANETSMENK